MGRKKTVGDPPVLVRRPGEKKPGPIGKAKREALKPRALALWSNGYAMSQIAATFDVTDATARSLVDEASKDFISHQRSEEFDVVGELIAHERNLKSQVQDMLRDSEHIMDDENARRAMVMDKHPDRSLADARFVGLGNRMKAQASLLEVSGRANDRIAKFLRVGEKDSETSTEWTPEKMTEVLSHPIEIVHVEPGPVMEWEDLEHEDEIPRYSGQVAKAVDEMAQERIDKIQDTRVKEIMAELLAESESKKEPA